MASQRAVAVVFIVFMHRPNADSIPAIPPSLEGMIQGATFSE